MGDRKITKLEAFVQIAEIIEASEAENKDELLEVVNKASEQLVAKAVKAKEKAAEKRAEGDALRNTVQEVLTDEWQSAQDITDAIGDEEVTKAKVVARLTQLVNAGVAEKDTAKTEGSSKKITVYKLAKTE